MFEVTAMTMPLSRLIISDIDHAAGELTVDAAGVRRQREAHEARPRSADAIIGGSCLHAAL